MRVDRIILLIAIIRVVENQAAPYASGGSTCGNFKRKYLFVLTPAANEKDLLTDLVKSAKSAVVKRPEIERDPVQVLISPQDFTEFKEKSQALKVYISHSLQCLDQTTNRGIVEIDTSQPLLAMTELNGKTKENSSIEITSPLALKTTKEFHSKMCRTSDDCESEFGKTMINASLSNDVKKILEATASPGTIFVGSSSSRKSRASKTKKGTTKQKSRVKIARKFLKGKTRSKPKEQKKSARKNDGMKSAKAEVTKKKKTLIPAHRTSTRESWNKLMSLASKSLMKSNNTSIKSKPRKEVKSNSIAIRKLLSSAKVAKAKKVTKLKKKSSKQANKPKTNNTRKTAAKTSTSAKKKAQSSNTRNRVNKQQKHRPNSQRERKTSSAVNPKTAKKIVAKKRKPNRKSRELRISAETETNCTDYNTRKRSLGHLVKRNFSFRAPGGCTIIKISNSCDGDCLDSDENTGNSPQIGGSQHPPMLFVPEVLPDVSIPDLPISLPDNPIGGTGQLPSLLPPGTDESEETPILPPLPIVPDYELEPLIPESVGPNDYPDEELDNEPNDDLPMEIPLRQFPNKSPSEKPFVFIPPFVGATSTQTPYWVIQTSLTNDNINPLPQEYSTMSPIPFEEPLEAPIGPEEDVEGADEYDEDNENYEDDDEEDYDEEYDEDETETEIPMMSIPDHILSMIGDNYLQRVWNEKNVGDTEDSNAKDVDKEEENESKDEDNDEDEDDEDDYDDDDENDVEESENAGIGDEDDYDSDED